MKKLITLVLVLTCLVSAAIPAMAATAAIKKTEYEGSGYVEVDFKKDVQYKSVKVTVKDSDGKSYTAKISEKDEDDLTFKVSNIKAGKTYNYTISGVRAGGSGSYGKVSGSFKVPAAKKLSIKELEYDRGDKEMEIEFSGKVEYSSAKVTVKDSSGKSYTAKIIEKENDGMEVRVSGLKKGSKYTVKVSGVRLKSAGGSYSSVSKSITVK